MTAAFLVLTKCTQGHRCYLARIGVVKAHEHLALVLLGKVLVQQGCLGMPYVKVARGLRGESGDHLAFFSILESNLKGAGVCTAETLHISIIIYIMCVC